MNVRYLGLVACLCAIGFADDDESEIEIETPPEKSDDKPEPPPKPEPERREPGGPTAKPQFKAPSANEINAAIDAGVAWLRKAQKEDGTWGFCVAGRRYDGAVGDRECYQVGPTAFAIFTLAKCGVSPKDKGIRKGLRWLDEHGHRPEERRARFGRERYSSTYESAAMVLMLAALNPPKNGKRAKKFSSSPRRPAPGFRQKDWRWMHEHVRHLIGEPGSDIRPCQVRNGGWRYWPRGSEEDLSATQFCLLALRAAARAGYPVHVASPDTWRNAIKAVRRHQVRDGSFVYRADYPWSAGMCAAGIASLLICREQMEWAGQDPPSDIDEQVRLGLEFLGRHWDVTQNLHGEERNGNSASHYHYYHLYGIERVGSLSGNREIGGKSWYLRGAAFLLGEQREDGAWDDTSCMRPTDVLGTCFALLFLKRATIPVLTDR